MNQMHGLQQPGMGIPPMLQQQQQQQQHQPSPQQMQGVMGPQIPTMVHPQQQQHQQQQQQQQQPPPQVEKIDNISKVKSLVVPLRESLSNTLKISAQLLQHNNFADNGSLKGVDNISPPPRFDKHLEEFYSICDQIELHLKTSIQCMQQNASAQRYLPVAVLPTRIEPMPATETGQISYPQYLQTVRLQIAYAKDIHDTLICAAQNISPSE